MSTGINLKILKNHMQNKNELNIATNNLPLLKHINPDNYDPSKPEIAHDIIVQLFEPLFKYKLTKPSEKKSFDIGALQGSLASSIKTKNSGLTYEVTLKKSGDSNGIPITSSDVLDSWQGAFQNRQIGRWVAMMGSVPRNEHSLEIIDEKRIRFNLESPNLLFPHLLTMLVPSITRSSNTRTDRNKLNTEEIYKAGFGPYQIESTNEQGWSLEANSYHWKEKTFFKKINYLLINNNQDSRLQHLINKEIDMIFAPTIDEIKKIKQDTSINIFRSLGNTRVALQISFKHEPLMDINIRKAISLTIPYNDIIEKVYDGNAVQWNGIVPHSVIGSIKFNKLIQNIADAKELMAKSSFKEFNSELIVDKDSKDSMQIAKIIQKSLSIIGISIQIICLERKVFRSRQIAGDFQLAIDRDLYRCNELGYILPHDFGDKKHGITNWNKYSNDTVNMLFKQAKETNNYKKRIQILQQSQKIIFSDLPWIPIALPTFNILHKKNISGITWNPRLSGYPSYNMLKWKE